jgi:hypothetical protein
VASSCEGVHVVKSPNNRYIDPVEEGAEVHEVRDPMEIEDVGVRALVDNLGGNGSSVVGKRLQPAGTIVFMGRERALNSFTAPAATYPGNEPVRGL